MVRWGEAFTLPARLDKTTPNQLKVVAMGADFPPDMPLFINLPCRRKFPFFTCQQGNNVFYPFSRKWARIRAA